MSNFLKNPKSSFDVSRERVRKPVDRLQIAPSPPAKHKAEAEEKGASKSPKTQIKSHKKGSAVDIDSTPRPGDRGFEKHDTSPYKEGDVVWAKWGKTYLPARIAKETEPSPAIFRTKKSGLVLMFWFETKDYSYVPKNAITVWTDDYEKRIALKSSKIFLDAINAAQKWLKSPGPYPEYISESEDDEDDSSDDESSEESSSSSEKKSKGSPKKGKAEDKSSPRKRQREESEEDEDEEEEDEQPPVKRQRLYGSEDEPKGVRKLRVMRELGLVPPERSPWAVKKSA